ncbi:TfoX/Sxy family protein [Microbacterium sp. ARD32]|uniref:TfoX/Sxy family protein n=1 Tax=Microbacterium sp. ARD32 TaxID=2962577 RepID=UPI0028827C60|nr:TfoX/Sxy family protein [Microbacterium sp. ARD32]MDT0157808.1 TfoX/Sxy family protein [Microbacterium sp. ARD32]
MTPSQEELVERIRELIADQPVQREVSMFGGRCIMINDKMIVGAQKDGGLLVRVDAEQHDELVLRSGARQATMGPGREMGPGWITVDAEELDADQLASWIDVALDYNAVVTGVSR